jgi:hypothetical protein
MRTQSIFIALMAVLMFIIIISGSALVVLYTLTNATESVPNTQNVTRVPTLAQQTDTGVIPSSQPPPSRTVFGNQVPTTLVYLPTLSTSNAYLVKQGQPITWAFELRNNNGMSVAGKWVNFYIDDLPAKGTWYQSPDVRLVYSGTDSASISPGVHTLKLDFLGDVTNAPCQYTTTFTVVS